MPIDELDDEAAVRNFCDNESGRWYAARIDVRDPHGGYAVQRINSGVVRPKVVTTARFRRSDSIFTIGSCFARGLESYLGHEEFDVLSLAEDFNGFENAAEGSRRLGFINKYNTFAVRYALEWALDPEQPFLESALIQLGDGTWVDPHTNPTLALADFERTRERRRIMDDVFGRVRSCRLVVITLGLIEAWRDRETGLYLNMTPTSAMRSRYPGRFRFGVLSFDENARNLEAVHDVLARFGHSELQIVVTVSPVPLLATFTSRDVIVANAHSKAVLRAAAEEFASAHDNVHYFPSYEMVTMTDRGLAWEEDGRHVRVDLVETIMGVFMASFFDSDAP